MKPVFRVFHALVASLLVLWTDAAPADALREATIPEISRGDFDDCSCILTALVREVFEDDIDRNYTQLVLVQDGEMLTAVIGGPDIDKPKYRSLVGATIRIAGHISPFHPQNRGCFGRLFVHNPRKHPITILRTTESAFETFSDVSEIGTRSPSQILTLGQHVATGQVLAVWRKTSILMRTASGRLLRADLNGVRAPSVGDTIVAAGFPEVSLFHLNLSHAIWRPSHVTLPASPAPPPRTVRAQDLVSTAGEKKFYSAPFHGQPIVLTGSLLHLPEKDDSSEPLLLDAQGVVVPVYAPAGSFGRLSPNSKLAVSGICLLDTDNWRPATPSNAIRGLFLVVQDPKGIRTLARPTWWTPSRLILIFGVITGVILVFLVRNRTARMKSELKAGERTRIAIELHDSVAQSLAGVALELEAARRVAGSGENALLGHLDRSVRTLKSCRDDLRNCLWDLRNPAIDHGDLALAITHTLKPHIEPDGVIVRSRLSIPRGSLPEDIQHIVLRIIRELTVNAVRHGRASVVLIAGVLDKDGLALSVSDNGCGFDSASAPGVLEGHFGLQGIRERLNRLGGTLVFRAGRKVGTHARINLPLAAIHRPTRRSNA